MTQLSPSAYRALMFVLLLLALPGAQAMEMKGIYETVVPVIDRGAETRKEALLQALQGVLVKITGDSHATGKASLIEEVGDPSRFIRQYEYRTVEADKSLNLWVRFDQKGLNRLLRDQGVPVWGKTRPSVLLWLAFEAPTGRFVLNPEALPEISGAVNLLSERRAIRFSLPLWDLEDRMNLRVGDLWGGFRDPVMNASARYEADVVLTGRLFPDLKGGWRARWSMLFDDLTENWESEGYLQQEVIGAGLNIAGDLLASRYAPQVVNRDEGEVLVHVVDVRDLNAFARVSHYLRGISSVKQVQLVRSESDAVWFQVGYRGGVEELTQIFELGDTLSVRPTLLRPFEHRPDAEPNRLPQLDYMLNP